MISKEWEAADLIFDLDADQIIKGAFSSYSHMLSAVKDETKKLLTFLTEDFALNEDHIRVVFSGGRGYHVYVREERLTKLGSHERREVINYVSGNGLEAEYIIYPKKISEYSESPTRWETRIAKWIERYFKSLLEMQERDAIEQLTSFKDVGRKKAKEIFENLEEIIENLDGGSDAPRLIKSRLTTESFWKGVVRRAILELKVNVDEPVTADTKRLIRLPSSLHGGSGFCVAPIDWEQFDDFDPLYDAIVFNDEMTPVMVLSKTTTDIKNERIIADEKTVELPEHTAIYLMARGYAEYEPRRSKSHKKQ
jgi:DNA primase small subunit